MNKLKLMLKKFNNLFLENQQDAFFIFYPEKIKRILEYFSKEFIGTVIYAVKANPADCVLEQVIKNGIRVLGDGLTKIGAHGKPVIFLNPSDVSGTLVELEQK